MTAIQAAFAGVVAAGVLAGRVLRNVERPVVVSGQNDDAGLEHAIAWDECHYTLDEDAALCPSTSAPQLILPVWNSSALLTAVASLEDAKERFGECFVFIYLKDDPLSIMFAKRILTFARVYPHAVFTHLEGQQIGDLVDGASPKSFPAFTFVKADKKMVYYGLYDDLEALNNFVIRVSGQGPLCVMEKDCPELGSVGDHHVSFVGDANQRWKTDYFLWFSLAFSCIEMFLFLKGVWFYKGAP